MSEEIANVFKSNIKNLQYIFSKGKVAHFRDGEYLTKNKSEIDELNAEVEAGHPHIYIDKNKVTASVEEANPLAAIEARIRAQIEAEQEGKRKLEESQSNQKFTIVSDAGIPLDHPSNKPATVASSTPTPLPIPEPKKPTDPNANQAQGLLEKLKAQEAAKTKQ